MNMFTMRSVTTKSQIDALIQKGTSIFTIFAPYLQTLRGPLNRI